MKTISHFRQIKNKLYAFMADVQGVTGIEYTIIAGVMGSAILSGTVMFGDEFSSMFQIDVGNWANGESALHGVNQE